MTTSSTPPGNSAPPRWDRLQRALTAGAVVAGATAGVIFTGLLVGNVLITFLGGEAVAIICALGIGVGLAVAAIDYRLQ